MFRALRDFITELAGDAPARTFAEDDHRLAVAALLVHLISVDGIVRPAEQAAISRTLASTYGLSPEETRRLVEEAREADDEAVDLYRFTSVLKRTLDEQGRLSVVEMMWQAVYADGTVTEFEENTVWRVAELLGVSTRERVALRQRVASLREAGATEAASATPPRPATA